MDLGVVNRAETVAARLGQELADYLYPTRDWMIDSRGCDADVAIVGSGRRALLLSYALRRERITRQLLIADPVSDLVEMHGALGEPRMGLPHLDLAGSEFWIPDAAFGAWLSAWTADDRDVPSGAALRAAWSDYLAWLARLFEVPAPVPTPLAAIELEPDRVRLIGPDGAVRTARRLVLAGPAADLDESIPWTIGGLEPKRIGDTSLPPEPRSLAGQRVLIVGDDLAASDWAVTALVEGGARAVVQVGNARQPASSDNDAAIASMLRHSFGWLRPEQRETVRAAAAFSCTVPSNWAHCLHNAGDRFRFVPAGGGASVPELLAAQDFDPDLVVVPARPRSSHAACAVRIADGRQCELADIFRHVGIDACYRLIGDDGAVLPAVAFGTGAVPSAGPRAQGRFLARYGLVDVLETTSCDFFVEDEGALFASFQEFRTSETFGGKLMETKP